MKSTVLDTKDIETKKAKFFPQGIHSIMWETDIFKIMFKSVQSVTEPCYLNFCENSHFCEKKGLSFNSLLYLHLFVQHTYECA